MRLTEQAYALAFAAGRLAGEIEHAKQLLNECIPSPIERHVCDVAAESSAKQSECFPADPDYSHDSSRPAVRIAELEKDREVALRRILELTRERDACLQRLEVVARERDAAIEQNKRFRRKYENRRKLLDDILTSFTMNVNTFPYAVGSFTGFMGSILDKLRIACADDRNSGE